MTSISYSQIKYVIALDKTGSFSDAANICFVTQSTLSTMIKRLENQLGLKLFDRQKKPIELTAEGKKLINQFKIIDNEYENLFDLFNETKSEFHGTLKIGIIPTLAPFLLPLFLDKINVKYPNLNLEINEITTHEIQNKLKLREIDVGLISIPIVDKELDQTHLFREEFLVYDTRGQSPKSKRYKIDEIDISKLWLLEESHCLTSQIGKICELKNDWKSEGNVKLLSGSILSLLELVKLKKGITLLPKLATLSDMIEKEFIFNLERPVPVREIGIVTLKNFLKKKLFDILKAEIVGSISSVLKPDKNSIDIKPF